MLLDSRSEKHYGPARFGAVSGTETHGCPPSTRDRLPPRARQNAMHADLPRRHHALRSRIPSLRLPGSPARLELGAVQDLSHHPVSTATSDESVRPSPAIS